MTQTVAKPETHALSSALKTDIYILRFGRFLSVDWSAIPAPVPYATLTNPQTLNLYQYVGNNPETFADLDGHLWPIGVQDPPIGHVASTETAIAAFCAKSGDSCSSASDQDEKEAKAKTKAAQQAQNQNQNEQLMVTPDKKKQISNMAMRLDNKTLTTI